MNMTNELTKDFEAAGFDVTLTASGTRMLTDRKVEPDGNGHEPDGWVGHALPPEELDVFHQFRGGEDKHQWELGRQVEICAVKYAGKIAITKIWKDAASAAEVSRAQIRKCHETWQGTDDDMRETFDVLTFEHFYTATLYCKDRNAVVKALAWCLDTAPDFGGRPAPASVLRKRLKKDPPEPTWTELQARAVGALERLRDATEGKRLHARLQDVLIEVEGMQAA